MNSVILFVMILSKFGLGFPLNAEDERDKSNLTSQDLYIIRTVTYEIGILSEENNDTNFDNLNETEDRIDFTFFNPSSTIDLSNISLPIIQTDESAAFPTIYSRSVPDLENSNKLIESFPYFKLLSNILFGNRTNNISNKTDLKETGFMEELSF